MTISGATARILVDAPKSWILDPTATDADYAGLAQRAELLSSLIATPAVQDLIARRMGVSTDQIVTRSRITANVTAVLREPDLEQRATHILYAQRPYRLDMQADPNLPILNIYSQAPSTAEAVKLADAAVAAVKEHVERIEANERISKHGRAVVHSLGQARGAVINGGTTPQIAVLTFLAIFGISCFVMLLATRARRGWAKARADSVLDAPRTRSLYVAPARPVAGGAWPHTTRVLPWMVAAVHGVLWLVPFNTIRVDGVASVRPQVRSVAVCRSSSRSGCSRWPSAARPRRASGRRGSTPAIAAFLSVACIGVRAQRPRAQPDARVRPREQEDLPAGLLCPVLHDRRQCRPARGGAGVPEVHAGPRRHLRARDHLGVPLPLQRLLRPLRQAAPGDLPGRGR